MADEKIDKKRPVQGESELKKMQQRLVDDTVDDSFPASDPPAWTTTGSKSVAARTDDATSQGSTGQQDRRSESQPGGSSAGLADRASHLAENALRTGERYLNEIRDRLPEAERYYERGRSAVARPVAAYPLAALLLAAATGYGLAWVIHGRAPSGSSGRNRPAYGRRPAGVGRAADRHPDERFPSGGGMGAARRQAMAASSAPSSY